MPAGGFISKYILKNVFYNRHPPYHEGCELWSKRVRHPPRGGGRGSGERLVFHGCKAAREGRATYLAGSRLYSSSRETKKETEKERGRGRRRLCSRRAAR